MQRGHPRFPWGETEEVHVSGEARGFVVPEDEEHGALEEEALGVLGLAETIEQALNAIADKQIIECLAADLREIEEAGLYR